MGCTAAICRIVPWNWRPEGIKGSDGSGAAEMGQISMLTARVSYGLGGLLLVNVVLLAAQMVLGIGNLPI